MDEHQLLGWCVVANVDAGAADHGTRHFSAGTKVWVLPPQWGDGGEDLFVVGRHRGRPGDLVRMVMPRDRLTDFRAKPVYSPTVMGLLGKPWRDDQAAATGWASRDAAEQAAQRWRDDPG